MQLRVAACAGITVKGEIEISGSAHRQVGVGKRAGAAVGTAGADRIGSVGDEIYEEVMAAATGFDGAIERARHGVLRNQSLALWGLKVMEGL